MGGDSAPYLVLIGDKDPETSLYTEYFKSGCHPILQGDVIVTSLENKLVEHLRERRVGGGVL